MYRRCNVYFRCIGGVRMAISQEIKDGLVYNVEIGDAYRIEELDVYEYTLIAELEVQTLDINTTKITGAVYKQHYEGKIVEIANEVALTVNFSGETQTINLTPNTGMLDVNIEIPDINDLNSLAFVENNVRNVFTSVNFKDGEIV